jgi:hypothetical protein
MRRFVYPLVLLGMLSGCNFPKEPLQKAGCGQYYRGNTEEAFKVLQAAQIFRIGPGSYAVPCEEIALRRIIDSDNAFALLEKLYETGTRAGQLYALLGLRYVNKAKCDELIPQMKTLNLAGLVETESGCSRDRKPIPVIIDGIGSGRYDKIMQGELNN